VPSQQLSGRPTPREISFLEIQVPLVPQKDGGEWELDSRPKAEPIACVKYSSCPLLALVHFVPQGWAAIGDGLYGASKAGLSAFRLVYQT